MTFINNLLDGSDITGDVTRKYTNIQMQVRYKPKVANLTRKYQIQRFRDSWINYQKKTEQLPPPLHDLKLKLPTKESLKNTVKQDLSNYWTP